jgi:hypothetical protein
LTTGEADSPYHVLLQTVQTAIEAGEFKAQEGFAVEIA